MKPRILIVPPDRLALYAEWLTEIAASIYTEHTLDETWIGRMRAELERNRSRPETLLLVSEMVDPTAAAGRTTPAGYREASVLLTLPFDDLLFPTGDASLRIFYTVPAFRARGFAGALLQKSREILASRGIKGLRADVFYGDDAIVGLFERQEFERGRMTLRREL